MEKYSGLGIICVTSVSAVNSAMEAHSYLLQGLIFLVMDQLCVYHALQVNRNMYTDLHICVV